jgi:hypothetical protein
MPSPTPTHHKTFPSTFSIGPPPKLIILFLKILAKMAADLPGQLTASGKTMGLMVKLYCQLETDHKMKKMIHPSPVFKE